MIVTGMTNKKELKTVAQRKTLLEIGLRACVLVRSMADVIAAGVMEKIYTFTPSPLARCVCVHIGLAAARDPMRLGPEPLVDAAEVSCKWSG
jgi:hypothetical protein